MAQSQRHNRRDKTQTWVIFAYLLWYALATKRTKKLGLAVERDSTVSSTNTPNKPGGGRAWFDALYGKLESNGKHYNGMLQGRSCSLARSEKISKKQMRYTASQLKMN